MSHSPPDPSAGSADPAPAGPAPRPRAASRRREVLAGLAICAVVAALTLSGVLSVVGPRAFERPYYAMWTGALAAVGLGIWLADVVLERVRKRTTSAWASALSGVALAAVVLQNGADLPGAVLHAEVSGWNFFHYYLGAKYYEEAGYFDLYPAVLAADEAWQARRAAAEPGRDPDRDRKKGWGFIEKARDMRTYEVVGRERLLKTFRPDTFTEERLAELGRDTRRLRPGMPKSRWQGVFKDLGFNPAPPWMAVFTPLTQWIEVGSRGQFLFANGDLVLFLLCFAGVWWAFSLRVAAVATLWMNTVLFNDALLVGGLFRYDWFASMVLSVCLYRLGRPGWAGGCLAWGAMTRVFPGMLAVPIAAHAVWGFARARGLSGVAPAHRRYLAALAAGCLVLGAASLTVGKGAQNWVEWKEKITIHSGLHPTTSDQRIGVARLALHSPKPGQPWAHLRGRGERPLGKSADKRHALQAVGALLLVPALVRRRDEDAMILMQFAVFLSVTVSRYYASPWVLLPAIGLVDRRRPLPWTAALSGAVLLLMPAIFPLFKVRAGWYFVANDLAYGLFAVLCAGLLVSDVRDWRRRRREASAPAPGPDPSGAEPTETPPSPTPEAVPAAG